MSMTAPSLILTTVVAVLGCLGLVSIHVVVNEDLADIRDGAQREVQRTGFGEGSTGYHAARTPISG